MIGFSVYLKKRHLKVTLILAIVAIFALFLGLKGGKNADIVIDTQARQHISYKVKNNDDRVNFIKSFGWEVATEPIETINVLIPVEFGDVYKNYNEIQKNQGLDLEKYKGKEVKKYTYEVTNYPKEKKYVHANILVYKNKIIGGDICSVKIDGFMHGFLKNE
ncbi:MAG: DUF4830 domain-containing protein [Oscillospiraceae bacterium]